MQELMQAHDAALLCSRSNMVASSHVPKDQCTDLSSVVSVAQCRGQRYVGNRLLAGVLLTTFERHNQMWQRVASGVYCLAWCLNS